MTTRKVKVTILTLATLAYAGCANSDRNGGIMSHPKWKSGFAPTASSEGDIQPGDPQILPETHVAAGKLLEAKGMYADAIYQYRLAIATNHDYAEAYQRLAVALARTGHHDEALDALAHAADVEPHDATLQNNIGYLLMRKERWSEAIGYLVKATKIDPEFARAHVNLGMCLSQLGRFDEAYNSFRAVLPEPDARYNLALMYRGKQRIPDAIRELRKTLEINPEFVPAQTQLAELEGRPYQPTTPGQNQPENAYAQGNRRNRDNQGSNRTMTMTPSQGDRQANESNMGPEPDYSHQQAPYGGQTPHGSQSAEQAPTRSGVMPMQKMTPMHGPNRANNTSTFGSTETRRSRNTMTPTSGYRGATVTAPAQSSSATRWTQSMSVTDSEEGGTCEADFAQVVSEDDYQITACFEQLALEQATYGASVADRPTMSMTIQGDDQDEEADEDMTPPALPSWPIPGEPMIDEPLENNSKKAPGNDKTGNGTSGPTSMKPMRPMHREYWEDDKTSDCAEPVIIPEAGIAIYTQPQTAGESTSDADDVTTTAVVDNADLAIESRKTSRPTTGTRVKTMSMSVISTDSTETGSQETSKTESPDNDAVGINTGEAAAEPASPTPIVDQSPAVMVGTMRSMHRVTPTSETADAPQRENNVRPVATMKPRYSSHTARDEKDDRKD